KKEVLAYESSVTRLCVRYEFNLENFFAYKFSVGLFDSTILAKTKKNRDIKEDGKGSLIWRKLLKLRPLYQFIRFEFDDWLQMGKLINIAGAVGICYLRVARNVGHRSRYFHALYDNIQSEQVPHDTLGSNIVLWKHFDDTYKFCFSSARTWDQIRARKPLMDKILINMVFQSCIYHLWKKRN
ncbi:hypothetical protein IGI04_022828, partial [Brassica rapa subsp. trilocularis]